MTPAPSNHTDAVLLLAYGGPDALDDVSRFLTAVRGGRPTSPVLLTEFVRRYALIGGGSPLLAITRRTAHRLSEKIGLPVYVGMRHWQPTIADSVRRMACDGVRRCVAICLAPHYSRLSIGRYRELVDSALLAVCGELSLFFVDHWHTSPCYLDGIAAATCEAMGRFANTSQVRVVFTAHSLPISGISQDDPYVDQFAESARLVARRLGLDGDQWICCYQSAPQTGSAWLAPAIEDVVAQLGAAGERNLLVVPMGFVADQLEVLYDLDIGLQEIAAQIGVRIERAPMLNDSPLLIEALAELVTARISSKRTELT